MVRLNESIVYSRTKSAVDVVKKLNLWGCDIDDIQICSRMVNLQILSLSMNRVKHLEPLKHCAKLEELYLRRNEIDSLHELEHLRGLKRLRILWIDENPCTKDNRHRSMVVKILPNLSRLDDKPVTVEDLMDARIHRRDYIDSNTVNDGRHVVDTALPNTKLFKLASSHSLGALDHSVSSSTMFSSICDSIVEDEQCEDMTWNEFSMDEYEMLPSESVMAMSLYDNSLSARSSRISSTETERQRSMSFPRRRCTNPSNKSLQRQRYEKILSAVSALLDELDDEGLRRVIDEAQRRIKKHR